MKEFVVPNEDEMAVWGNKLGESLKGGETIELVGDIGAGKTTLTKSIALGLGVVGQITSPTFTLSNRYECRDGLTLVHYDFYRLHDPGIMHDELDEVVRDSHTVVVIEWGKDVKGVLPKDRLTIQITPLSETSRRLTLTTGGTATDRLLGEL